jgi:hypothetical protein
VTRLMTLCVLVALCIGGQAPAMASAATPGDASASASAQDVDPGYGCADTLVTYSVSLPPEATSWILGIRADSESAVSTWTYFDSASGDPLAGQGSMQICSEGEREERTLTWKVDWTYVDQGDLIHASDSGTGATFVVNGVTAPSPFACPECDDTTTLGLRVVRKLDRVWVLKSVLRWRRGSDSARIADARLTLVGPQGSGFKALVRYTDARGAATFRVKVPQRPERLRTYFASGRATWNGATIGLPRTRSARIRVG